ncbi:hypothetical protein ACIBSV_50305 [Embleya sp. NPDC050154]
MNTQTYRSPVIADAGDAKAVTLGKNNFNRVDGTQYKEKRPGVAPSHR